VTRLRVNKQSLSATLRKKTSAEDNRTSSKSIGFVGMSFIGGVFGLIIAADAIKFVTYITALKSAAKSPIT